MEDHSNIATREERDRNETNWVLSLNKGVQGPLNQRPDFVEAKRKMKRLHGERAKETSEGNTPIHPRQGTRQRRNQQFEGLEKYEYQTDAKQDGGPILRSHRETCGIQHLRLHQLNGNSTTIGSRTKVGILATLILDRTAVFFFFSEMPFRLAEIRIP